MGEVPLKLVSVGETTMDHYISLKQRYVGGISLNFAVHAKRCGAEAVSLVSCIGADYGERILEKLAHENVNSTHVTITSGATAQQNILLTPGGERMFPPDGYHVGVLENYRLSDDDLSFIQKHNVLSSALFKQVEPLFGQVIESLSFEGWRVADFLDLSDYNKDIGIIERFIESLTIVFISGDHDLVNRLRPLSHATRCLIVITLGPEGSVALMNGEPIYQPSIHIARVVDSTGCGDAFQAAFTVSYWSNGDVKLALQRGAQQAAHVIQHYGSS